MKISFMAWVLGLGLLVLAWGGPGHGDEARAAEGATSEASVATRPTTRGPATREAVASQPGRVLRGRVVDSKGKPPGRADVRVNVGRSARGASVKLLRTDAEGRFVWDGAPAEELTLTPQGPGIVASRSVTVGAGESDVEIVVGAPVRVRGKITDDVTGKPVTGFTIQVWGDRDQITHMGVRSGADGSYEVAARDGAAHYRARIVANGYVAVESGELPRVDDVLIFDARLSKDKGIEVTILRADGKPATGAEALFWDVGMPTFMNGKPVGWRGMGLTYTVDAKGRVILPVGTKMLRLFVVDDTGWVDLLQDASLPLASLELREWCTVTGRVVVDGKPVAGETVTIDPQPVPNYDKVNRQVFHYVLKTDGEGRFTATRVPDGKFVVALRRTVKAEGGGASRFVLLGKVVVDLKPGETKKDVQIGDGGTDGH